LALLAPSAAGAYVYWSSLSGVGRANLDGSAGDFRFIDVLTTCGVAVTQSRIYWGIDRGSIGVGGLDGSVINGRLLDAPSYFCGFGGIAADATYIYWANENQPDFDTIGRAKLDGSSVEQRFVTGAINPCGVVVDSAHIYWATGNSGRGPGTTIGRANLDGSAVEPNFITGLSGPCGVAVDAGHIYWGNMNTNTIGRANLDGGAVETSFIAGATQPCGVAIDSAHIYWAQASGPIGRANLDGSGANQAFIADTRGQCHVAVDALISATVSIAPSPASIIYGEDITFTTKVGGGAGTPTGTVRFQVDGDNVGEPVALDGDGGVGFDPPFLLDVGSTITARYAGDSKYGPSRGDVQPQVKQAATVTSLISSANPAPADDETTITASVKNSNTAATPFGSVQFLIDGEAVIEPLPLDDNGEAGISLSGFEAGEYVVLARYHDDTAAVPDFLDSQATLTQRISSTPAAVPFAPPPPAPTVTALPPSQASNAFTLLRRTASSHGVIRLRMRASDPGTFRATATRCSPAKPRCAATTPAYGTGRRTTRASGPVTLAVRPNAKARAALARGRAMRVSVSVRFQSAKGGSVKTRRTSVLVKGPRPARRSAKPRSSGLGA